jgi:DNA primase
MAIDVKALKAAVDCRELVKRDLGEPRHRTAKVLQWRCPFHNGKTTTSLTAWQNGWQCFGCGKSGDAIAWVMTRHNLTFADACERLGSGDLPKLSLTDLHPPPVRLPEPPSEDWQDLAIKMVITCADALWGKSGADALGKLRARGLSDDTIKDAWLGYSMGRGITIPWRQVGTNTLWAVKIRRDAGEPRYVSVEGSKAALYLADDLAGRDVAVVCEGEFDALLLKQEAGDLAAVVTFGGAAAHDVAGWLPYLMHVKRVFVATDNDPAGEKAWQYWQGKTKRARRLAPPGGCNDLTDAHLAGHDLRAWVMGAIS